MPPRTHLGIVATVAFAAVAMVGACTSATPASPAGEMTWTGATSVGGLGGATINDVATYPAGFIAVGSFMLDGHSRGGIWRSTDGTTWSATKDVGMADMSVLRVVQGGPGLVALNVDCQPGAGECAAPSIWTSPDSVAWTMAARLDDCCVPAALNATSLGLVAVGGDFSTGYPQTPADAAAFISTDATTWTKAVASDSFKGATMGAAVAGGPGLIALGDALAGPIAWSSKDGRTWTAVATPPGPSSAQVRDAVAAGGRIVAVGRDAGRATSWTSPDGIAWTAAPSADALKGGQMDRVAASGATYVAVGKNTAGSAVWTSRDGLAWTLSTTSRTADEFRFVAANATRAVAIGAASDGTVVIFTGR